ncbi:hypothetical protein LTR48_000532 [Friedmanniomyces endolithicus]|nr:hypothetical protein LTR48_000532 [Friedmanniomyces endolithicus]
MPGQHLPDNRLRALQHPLERLLDTIPRLALEHDLDLGVGDFALDEEGVVLLQGELFGAGLARGGVFGEDEVDVVVAFAGAEDGGVAED